MPIFSQGIGNFFHLFVIFFQNMQHTSNYYVYNNVINKQKQMLNKLNHNTMETISTKQQFEKKFDSFVDLNQIIKCKGSYNTIIYFIVTWDPKKAEGEARLFDNNGKYMSNFVSKDLCELMESVEDCIFCNE